MGWIQLVNLHKAIMEFLFLKHFCGNPIHHKHTVSSDIRVKCEVESSALAILSKIVRQEFAAEAILKVEFLKYVSTYHFIIIEK